MVKALKNLFKKGLFTLFCLMNLKSIVLYFEILHEKIQCKGWVKPLALLLITKDGHVSDEGIENRIMQIERALRPQQAQNRMIKNKYEKLIGQLENVAKRSIQTVLFE